MLDWPKVEEARVGKTEFILARDGDDWVVRVGQRILMTNRVHQSEISLAEEAIGRATNPKSVLVGGLGLGYTLRATLDLMPKDSQVTVIELVPELVDWNRRHLKHLNDSPLEDPRCTVIVGDAYDVCARLRRKFDVILLDVDNGPQALSQARNQRLYSDAGTSVWRTALTPGGVLGVWSAGPNAKYAARVARHGFEVEVLRVPARTGGRATHILFLGKKAAHEESSRGAKRPSNQRPRR